MPHSRRVSSNQQGVHPNLNALVSKHLSSQSRKPVAKHTIEAFDSLPEKIRNRAIILDIGCGNGRSTHQLAAQYPDAFVIGIDKSAARLSRHRTPQRPADTKNYCVIRANAVDFYRLMQQSTLHLSKHYFLYPNPWPKKKHLGRRWHGSPIFRQILALGGKLELRTNWQIYAEEFSLALAQAKIASETIELRTFLPDYMTDFEEKYHASGHQLWQLTANLDEH